MKTFMANPAKIDRKWYVVDAEGQTLGRLASEVAKVLRGKNKPEFTPHVAVSYTHLDVYKRQVRILSGKRPAGCDQQQRSAADDRRTDEERTCGDFSGSLCDQNACGRRINRIK